MIYAILAKAAPWFLLGLLAALMVEMETEPTEETIRPNRVLAFLEFCQRWI